VTGESGHYVSLCQGCRKQYNRVSGKPGQAKASLHNASLVPEHLASAVCMQTVSKSTPKSRASVLAKCFLVKNMFERSSHRVGQSFADTREPELDDTRMESIKRESRTA